MKHQLTTAFIGLTAAALVFMPTTAYAQQPSQAQPIAEQRQELIETLNLTEQQQNEIAAIRADTRSQIETVLTPEQKQALWDGVNQQQSLQDILASLNISPEQRSQIVAILQSSREQFRATLTDEQRQQLRQELRARFMRFRQNR